MLISIVSSKHYGSIALSSIPITRSLGCISLNKLFLHIVIPNKRILSTRINTKKYHEQVEVPSNVFHEDIFFR